MKIGFIDSDGRFHFKTSSQLRTALGYMIATDGGRTRLVSGCNLEQTSASLLDVIRSDGTSREIFFGSFFEALKKIFVYDRTTRFGDGYCGAATVLWQVATRELGCDHSGYDFAY